MEKVEELIARVEVELFGKTYQIEPSFKLVAEFELRMKSSIVNLEHWHPRPKVSAAALLLWLGIGGAKSGKTLEEVAGQVRAVHLGKAEALAILVSDQL